MTASRRAIVLLAVAVSSLVAAACGTKKAKVEVVTVTAPAPTTSASVPKTTATSSTPATTTSSTPATTTSTTTPTAPASASSPKADLAAAEASVTKRGYTPAVTYSYHPDATLGVILGTRPSGEEQAFFFVRGRYIGTDTKDPSAGISVVGQDDTSVTLRYALYAPGDPLTQPSGSANVTYTLDNGKLEPQDPIPSSSTTAKLSRR